jgi:putative membrane protein
MQPLAVVFALLAAAIHAWFFVLESILFVRPSVWSRFGLQSEAEAGIARSFAYNQGFYNLFLAVGAVAGVVLGLSGNAAAGLPLVVFACGSMVAAGVVLVTRNPTFAQAAAIQIVPPLIAIAGLLFLG